MLTQLVYILDQKKKADRMLTFVLMRSAFCRGVGVHKERLDCNVIVPYFGHMHNAMFKAFGSRKNLTLYVGVKSKM